MDSKITHKEILISVLLILSYTFTGINIINNNGNLALICLCLSAVFVLLIVYLIIADSEVEIGRLKRRIESGKTEINNKPSIEKIGKKKKGEPEKTRSASGNAYIQSRLSDYDNIDFEITDDGINTSFVKNYQETKQNERSHVTIATAKKKAMEAAKQTEQIARVAKENAIQSGNMANTLGNKTVKSGSSDRTSASKDAKRRSRQVQRVKTKESTHVNPQSTVTQSTVSQSADTQSHRLKIHKVQNYRQRYHNLRMFLKSKQHQQQWWKVKIYRIQWFQRKLLKQPENQERTEQNRNLYLISRQNLILNLRKITLLTD